MTLYQMLRALQGASPKSGKGWPHPARRPCLAHTNQSRDSPSRDLGGQWCQGKGSADAQAPASEGVSERTQDLEPSRLSRTLQPLCSPILCIQRGCLHLPHGTDSEVRKTTACGVPSSCPARTVGSHSGQPPVRLPDFKLVLEKQPQQPATRTHAQDALPSSPGTTSSSVMAEQQPGKATRKHSPVFLRCHAQT